MLDFFPPAAPPAPPSSSTLDTLSTRFMPATLLWGTCAPTSTMSVYCLHVTANAKLQGHLFPHTIRVHALVQSTLFTHTHTHTHAYTHARTHTRAYTHVHAYTHIDAHARVKPPSTRVARLYTFFQASSPRRFRRCLTVRERISFLFFEINNVFCLKPHQMYGASSLKRGVQSRRCAEWTTKSPPRRAADLSRSMQRQLVIHEANVQRAGTTSVQPAFWINQPPLPSCVFNFKPPAANV